MRTKEFKHQERLIEYIKENIKGNISYIEEVANILQINYDAAYRRLNCKVPFSFEEAVKISNHLGLSLTKIISESKKGCYMVCENIVENEGELKEKIRQKLQYIVDLKLSKIKILYLTDEIPMFFFFKNPALLKIRIYTWYFYFNINKGAEFMNYSDFQVTQDLASLTRDVIDIYKTKGVVEVWGTQAINNFISQIYYFIQYNFLDIREAEDIILNIRSELKLFEQEIIEQQNQEKKLDRLKVYKSDFYDNSNMMLFDINDQKTFIHLDKTLNFYTVKDVEACKRKEKFMESHLNFCTQITGNNSVSRNAFFNQNYNIIQRALKLLENYNVKDLFV